MTRSDARMRRPAWSAAPHSGRRRWIRLLLCAMVPLALFYFAWLLTPERVGHPVLYALLVLAEVFNAAQALGFWWTCSRERRWRRHVWNGAPPAVDVFVPVYGEPVSVVEPTIRAATAMTGALVTVHLLDDGDSDEMAAMASRHGAGYLRRSERSGAKAGNINHALDRTDAPFVVVLDCDHVPEPHFLEATLGCFSDERVAFAQAPSTTPTGTAARFRPPPGGSRRCSSARSRAARTRTTRCSAAARTWCSGARRSRASAASRSIR